MIGDYVGEVLAIRRFVRIFAERVQYACGTLWFSRGADIPSVPDQPVMRR